MSKLPYPSWPPRWLDGHGFQSPRNKSKRIFGLTALLLFFVLLLVRRRNELPDLTTSLDFQHSFGLPYPENAQSLWRKLLPLLEEGNPGVGSPTIQDDAISTYWEANLEFDLMDKTNMLHGDILKMNRAHRRFMGSIGHTLPRYSPTQHGIRRGIVTVAGGDYMPAAMVSLRMLRRTGSTLPVEVWMADQDEYEPAICDEILPKFNARCRLLSDVFGAVDMPQSQTISHFQYKIFAILFSSFDEVLFLDSDSFPLHNPQQIFDASVYRSTGMVTWPDLWATSISPAYYLIADQEPPAIITRASTESGQFLINKRTHWRTLLLAAYYNYYGPSHYYLLLCQGGFGRGDKSTFIPAAIAAGDSFYDVSERPTPIGHMRDWLDIYALVQFDAIEDHTLTSHGLQRVKNSSVADPPRPFFFHTTNPKWNAAKLFGPHDSNEHGFSNSATTDSEGRPSFAYVDPPEDVARVAHVERQLWEETRWVACQLEDKFKTWTGREDICRAVEEWFETFLDKPHEPEKTVEKEQSGQDQPQMNAELPDGRPEGVKPEGEAAVSEGQGSSEDAQKEQHEQSEGAQDIRRPESDGQEQQDSAEHDAQQGPGEHSIQHEGGEHTVAPPSPSDHEPEDKAQPIPASHSGIAQDGVPTNPSAPAMGSSDVARLAAQVAKTISKPAEEDHGGAHVDAELTVSGHEVGSGSESGGVKVHDGSEDD